MHIERYLALFIAASTSDGDGGKDDDGGSVDGGVSVTALAGW